MDNQWRPAPNTREDIKKLADDLHNAYTGYDGSVGRILDRKYHDRTAYEAVRNHERQMFDLFRRIDFLVMIQQGLEHKTFTDVVLSGILRAGDALRSLDILAEIEHNDPIREIERKARENDTR